MGRVPWMGDFTDLWKSVTFAEIGKAVPLLMSCIKTPPAPWTLQQGDSSLMLRPLVP